MEIKQTYAAVDYKTLLLKLLLSESVLVIGKDKSWFVGLEGFTEEEINNLQALLNINE